MWDLESNCFGVSIISQEINDTESLFGKFKRLGFIVNTQFFIMSLLKYLYKRKHPDILLQTANS